MVAKNQTDRRKPSTDGPMAEEPKDEPTNQAADTIAMDPPAAQADSTIESDDEIATRFKVQIGLNALQSWKLDVESANQRKDRSELVQKWIEPHLAKVECGPQPGWVKKAMAKLANRSKKRKVA